MQLKKSANKHFQSYVVRAINNISSIKQQLDDYEILREFSNVFPE